MAVEWDPAKAKANAAKHGGRFADAASALEDEYALSIADDTAYENRWITVGLDCFGRVACCRIHVAWRPGAADFSASGYAAGAEAVRGGVVKKEYDFSHGKRGAVVRVSPNKTRVTIRLDEDVLTWFRRQVEEAGGGNYQTLINDALRGVIARRQEALENTLRRVIRDELRRAG